MKVKSSRLDVAKNIVCPLILVRIWGFLIINWNSFPEKIPGHYNFAGEVDRWANKGELFILPIIATIIYFVISLLERSPQIWNTGVKVTEENRAKVYSVLKSMIITLKLVLVALFSVLSVCQTTAKPLPPWLIALVLVLVFGSIILYVIKLNKIK